jgi:hypothetical protein
MSDFARFPTRRRLIATGAFAASGFVFANDAFAQDLSPTPSCHDGDEPTMPETEGPFFKPKSPRRSDLREPGIVGRPVELSGVVLTRACRPVAGDQSESLVAISRCAHICSGSQSMSSIRAG